MQENTEDLTSLESLIASKVQQLDDLKADITELNDSMKNIFINHAGLVEMEKQTKEQRQQLSKLKKEITGSPEYQSLKAKLTEYQEEFKDVRDSLTSMLIKLYQLTGVQEIDTPNGIREFILKAIVKGKGFGKKRSQVPENQMNVFTGETVAEAI